MTMNHSTPPRGKGCIPYLIVALILSALVYLVVSSDNASSASRSTAPAAPNPAANPAPFNPDDLFLNLVHSAPGDLVASTGNDTDLVHLGQSVCGALEADHTVSEIYLAAQSAGYPEELLPTVLDAAAAAYCPQYNGRVDTYETGWES